MRSLLMLILSLIPAVQTIAGPEDVFTLPGDTITGAIVTRNPDLTLDQAPEASMLRTLLGIVDVLNRRDASLLARLAAPDTRVGKDRTIEHLVTIRLIGKQSAKMIRVGRVEDGWVAARVVGGDPEDAARLRDDLFQELQARWSAMPWPLDATLPIQPGRLQTLETPYTPGRVLLTENTASKRLFGGERLQLNELSRDLQSEEILARIPDFSHPGTPRGILIWINASSDSGIPAPVTAAADELGLVVATANNIGNSRPLLDRFQLIFDTLETVASRTLIDPDRVYLSGISGGGRSATMLCATFPEVFTGAIGVVGMNSSHVVQTYDGRRLPAQYREPRAELRQIMRTRRIAGITGTGDYNEPEMTARTAAMKRSGMDVMLLREDGLEHAMCSTESFTQTLRWVDDGVTAAREQGLTAARAQLDRFKKRFANRTSLTRADEKALTRIIEMVPWSDVAWEAAGFMGFDRPTSSQGEPAQPSVP